MLDINAEFYKGMLFINLKGELTKNTSANLINEVKCIKEVYSDKAYLNIDELDYIDNHGFDTINKMSEKMYQKNMSIEISNLKVINLRGNI